MLLEEWNTEDAIAYAKKEGIEEGREERNEYFLSLLDEGLPVEEIKRKVLNHDYIR
jgi:hypothetical protein